MPMSDSTVATVRTSNKLRDVVKQSAPISEVVWRSADGTSLAWRVDRGEWRICVRDAAHARHLGRLTGVHTSGRSIVGPFEEYFELNARKLLGKTVLRILDRACDE